MSSVLSQIEQTPIAKLIHDVSRWDSNASLDGGIVNADGEVSSKRPMLQRTEKTIG